MEQSALNILILGANYSPETTGNAPYTTSLSRALAARGATVRVLTTYPHYPEWRVREGYSGFSATERSDGVDVVRLRHYIPSSPTPVRRLLAELSFGVRLACAPWGRRDLVLLVSPSLFSSAVAMARIRVARRFGRSMEPTALWTQDLYSLGVAETGTGGKTVERGVRGVEAWLVRRADGVVAIHERFKAHIERNLGGSPEATVVVRNWTHLTRVADVDVAAVRARHGWADDEVIVLHSGNQGAKQGLENVVDAARLAAERGERTRFVLLGDGSQRQMLEERARGNERLQFIGSLDDADYQAALRAADILLVNELPGLSEMSLPSKLTSYFDSGRPVLAATDSASTTAQELGASGAGVRVDAGQPGELLRAALELGADTARQDELGTAGLRYRRDVLSEDGAVERMHGWFLDLVERRAARVAQASRSGGGPAARSGSRERSGGTITR